MGDNNWASLEHQNQSAKNAKMILPKHFKYIRGEKESTETTTKWDYTIRLNPEDRINKNGGPTFFSQKTEPEDRKNEVV